MQPTNQVNTSVYSIVGTGPMIPPTKFNTCKVVEFDQDKLESFNLLYCNGILSNYAEEGFQRGRLVEQVQIISAAFRNRKVTVFNNPTNLDEYLCLNQTNQQRAEKEQKIASEFADLIRIKIKEISLNKQSTPSICLMAHSHGAWITKKALEVLNPDERKHIHVYTFGGVVMIPKKLAASVENYVFKGDMISRGGNKRYDPEGTLERVVKIQQRSLAEKTSIEKALFSQFLEEWYAELDPSSDSVDINDDTERKDKISKYLSNFWSNKPEEVKGLEERYEKYSSCLKDYSITLLSHPIEENSELFKGQFSDLIQFMKQKTASYSTEVDSKCHIIPAYKKVIEDIAKRELPKIDNNGTKNNKKQAESQIPTGNWGF